MTKDHPFVRPKRPSLRPDLAPARALRAGVVEDAACGTGEAGAKRPRRPRAQRYAHQPGTPSPSTPDGITALPKCLIIGGESPPLKLSNLRGTPGHCIIITGSTGDRPVVILGGSGNKTVEIIDSSYIVISNLVIDS